MNTIFQKSLLFVIYDFTVTIILSSWVSSWFIHVMTQVLAVLNNNFTIKLYIITKRNWNIIMFRGFIRTPFSTERKRDKLFLQLCFSFKTCCLRNYCLLRIQMADTQEFVFKMLNIFNTSKMSLKATLIFYKRQFKKSNTIPMYLCKWVTPTTKLYVLLVFVTMDENVEIFSVSISLCLTISLLISFILSAFLLQHDFYFLSSLFAMSFSLSSFLSFDSLYP